MSTAIDLGTISAGVTLDLSGLKTSRALAAQELSAISSALDRLATQAEVDGKRVAAATFSREQKAALKAQEQALKESAARIQAFRAETIGAFTSVAAGITLAGIAAVKMSADFESSMTRISNNTTMTTADIAQMKRTVIALGKESGASFDDLAEGFAHITNFGFKAADSTVILREAMKSAVATGSKVSDTADILAKSLHEFGLNASDASKAMNVMHLAAAEGNMTLQQFDQAAGPAFAQAANLGVGLTDVASAMAALTRHGLDASEAATQVKDILVHLINPSKSAREELEKLSEKTGINLVADFSQAGLKAKGLTGVLDDLARATGGNGQEIYKLIQAQRGGLGAMILAGNGARDYKDILLSTSDAMSGKIDPTTEAYNKTLKNLNNEIARVANEIRADFLPVGEKLTPLFEAAIPIIRTTAHVLTEVLDAFNALPQPLQEAILLAGTFKLGTMGLNMALGSLGGSLPGLIGGVGKLGGAFGEVTTAEGLTASAGASAFATGGAWAVGIAGAIALVWSLKGAWEKLSGAQDKALHDKVWAEINSGRAAPATSLGEQVAANRREATRILASPEYTQSKSEIASNQESIARIKQGGVQAFTKNGETPAAALSEYNYALKTAQDNLAEAKAAVAKFEQDAHELRRDASVMGGSNGLTEAMAKHLNEKTIVECGQAVTNALKAAGYTGTASALAKAAIADKSRQLRPDSAGNFPPGTIIYFPDKKHPNSVSGTGQQHFTVASALDPAGRQTMLESTTAGGQGRHYRGDRTFGEIAAEHGGNYFAFAPGTSGSAKAGSGGYTAPVDPEAAKEKAKDQATLTQDLKDQLFEATHGQFANRKYEALRDKQKSDSDNSATPASRAEAQKLYVAKIAEINADERKEQKKHYDELLRQWREYLRAKGEAEKQSRDTVQRISKQAAERKTNLSDLSADMADSTAASSEDPETYQFGKDREEAAKRLRARQDAIAKNTTLGPYGVNDINPGDLLAQAQKEYDAAMAHIQVEEDAKLARDKEREDARAQAAQERSDRMIAEADRAAEKERLDIEETAKFEYDHGMISLAQYQAFLKAKLASLSQWQDDSHTILNKDWMAAKENYDASRGDKKQKPGEDPFAFLGNGMKTSFGEELEKTLDGSKGKLHGMKAEIHDWEDAAIKAIKHVAVAWAMAQLFGGKFGSGFNFGNNIFGGSGKKDGADGSLALGALSAIGSGVGGKTAWGGTVPTTQILLGKGSHGLNNSLSGNLLGALPQIGQLGGLLGSIHGINGPVGGTPAAGGGGAADLLGLAASFLPGGSLLGKLFGGGSGLFGGLKKIFHFATGGVVPGVGFHDSVPAMLTPGERVIPKGQGAAGPTQFHFAHYGDINNVPEMQQMLDDHAWTVNTMIHTATPGGVG